MWDRLKRVLGIGSGTRDSDEIIDSLYGSVVNRNLYFHLFIIIYELIMLFSISLRPGGPFVKPSRTGMDWQEKGQPPLLFQDRVWVYGVL